jgi:hypothetical protein
MMLSKSILYQMVSWLSCERFNHVMKDRVDEIGGFSAFILMMSSEGGIWENDDNKYKV